MNALDCIKVLDPALTNLFGKATVENALALDKLLGIDEYTKFYERWGNGTDYPPISDELRNLYESLTGPHAKTILRMWQIKKGLDCNGSPAKS